MKKLLLIFALAFIVNGTYGQNAEALIQEGIAYHDNGEYAKAIGVYKKALKEDPASPLIHYEIALSYMYAGDYEKGIYHSDIVIKQNKQYQLGAYMTKGSCLDYMGRTRESIKLFEKGIKKFGDHYLLHYNLAYNYYGLKDYRKAEHSLLKAIQNNPGHSSSHLLLGILKAETHERIPSMLSLYYFLLLEPVSERSVRAYSLLRNQMESSVRKEETDSNRVNIHINYNTKSEFASVELMLSILEASRSLEENRGKTDEELFIGNTKSFFLFFGDYKERKSNLWWDFYIPLFNEIAHSDYMEVFGYYISQSSNERAVEWLGSHEEQANRFFLWLNEVRKN